MPVYTDSESFYDIIRTLFQRLMAQPEAQTALASSPMIVRLQVSDPQASLTIDTKTSPPVFFLGQDEGPVDIELQMSADTLHRIWMDEVRLRDAFMAGDVQVTGDVFKALHLSDLFRQAEILYPQILQEKGRLD